MLLSLLYHRVGNGKYANPLSLFEQHLAWIQKRFQSVHPGDLLAGRRSICLTFDDALFDFYYYIFPILQELKLKAVLSVSVGLVPEKVSLPSEKRLKKIQSLTEKASLLPSPAYCTWDEIRKMKDSSLIHIASHSVNHLPLTAQGVDPKYELVSSKIQLEKELQTPITTFVYPYGKFNASVHCLAKKHYPYIMRIGNAINFSWHNKNQLLYRINADALPHHLAPFTSSCRCRYFIRYFLNTLRKK